VPLVMEKSPLLAIVPRMSGVEPVFVSVTFWLPLVVPTFSFPNESSEELSEARGLMVVACNVTVCGLPAALSVMTSEALWAPI